MPDRSSNLKKKRPRDPNALAAAIVAESTGDQIPVEEGPKKNPAAVELGRLGGKKGGKARAEKLTAEQRRDIARRAANIRWQAR